MRFIEVLGGLQMPVSNEEQTLIDMIVKEQGHLSGTGLDERQRELARKMVSRGVLHRTVREGKTFYSVNDLQDLWRN